LFTVDVFSLYLGIATIAQQLS